jgi:hypothetical protein
MTWFILLTGGYDLPELVGPFSSENAALDFANYNIKGDWLVIDTSTAIAPKAFSGGRP